MIEKLQEVGVKPFNNHLEILPDFSKISLSKYFTRIFNF